MVQLLSILIFAPLIAAGVLYVGGRQNPRVARVGSLGVSSFVLLLAIYAYASIFREGTGASFNFVEGPWRWIPTLSGVDYYLGLDGLGAVLVLISAFLTVLVVLGSWDLIKEREALYYALVLLFEGSIIGVFTSINLVLFYVFWELVLIPMFFFIGIWGGPRRKYAAMKFFLFTFVGSTVMLLGFIGLYLFAQASTPTFNIPELVGKIPFWLQSLATLATFIGFGVKLPVVPFHTWLPDAHVEAPAPISVFLAGLLLKMGGYGIIRVNLGLFPDASREFGWVFIVIGLVTMFYGALVAMIQRDLKRMIALTSINHMGFVLLGAYAGVLAPNVQGAIFGISGAIFQMFNHAAAIGILFMLSGYVHEQAGTRDISDLRGLKEAMPRTAILLMLGSMAGMGLPIYSSFLSEWMVIFGAVAVDIRLAVGVLVPGITVAYFLWMIWRTTFSAPRPEVTYHDMSMFSALTLAIYLLPLVIMLIFPFLILNVVDPLTQTYLQFREGS